MQSYTAATGRGGTAKGGQSSDQSVRFLGWVGLDHPHHQPDHKMMELTCAPEVLHRDPETLGAGQQVVLERGQALLLGHLHADAVLLRREARSLAEEQELSVGGEDEAERRSGY